MKRDIVLEVVYPVSPEAGFWRAITDSKLLAEWLMQNDFSPVVGASCQFKMKLQPGFREL